MIMKQKRKKNKMILMILRKKIFQWKKKGKLKEKYEIKNQDNYL